MSPEAPSDDGARPDGVKTLDGLESCERAIERERVCGDDDPIFVVECTGHDGLPTQRHYH